MINGIIILLTVIASVIGFRNQRFAEWGILHPPSVYYHGQYHRLLSSGFLHQGWLHLLFNMTTLYFFGPVVLRAYESSYGETTGSVLYIGLYFVSMIIAGIPTVREHKDDHHYTSLGASGAIAGVLLASVILSPFSTILLMVIIPMPALAFAALFLAYSLFRTYNPGQDGINHSAHLYGALVGMVFLLVTLPGSAMSFVETLQNHWRF